MILNTHPQNWLIWEYAKEWLNNRNYDTSVWSVQIADHFKHCSFVTCALHAIIFDHFWCVQFDFIIHLFVLAYVLFAWLFLSTLTCLLLPPLLNMQVLCMGTLIYHDEVLLLSFSAVLNQSCSSSLTYLTAKFALYRACSRSAIIFLCKATFLSLTSLDLSMIDGHCNGAVEADSSL